VADFALIDTAASLGALAGELAGLSPSTLYLDTEFDAGPRGTTLCLVQLAVGGATFLIDALAVDLRPLAGALGAPGAEWVLHAGRQDVPLLCEKLGLAGPPRVFDTQVAWALTSAEANVALAYIEFCLLGVRAGKGHQADDWRRRPLPAGQLAYAARDVAHLPQIRERLAEKLAERGRLAIAYDASREAVLPPSDAGAPLTLGSFRNAWQLDARGQAALVALLAWAHRLPPHEEQPSDTKTWLSLAARLPSSVDDLARIKGVPRRFSEKYGAELVPLLRRAAAEAETGSFVPLEPQPYATHDELEARAWLELVRARACRLLDAAPEVALPNRLVDRMRSALLDRVEPARLLDLAPGFRRELLGPVWAQAVQAAGSLR